MPRYAPAILGFVFAVGILAHGQQPAEHFRPRPAPADAHKFGVDPEKIGREPVEIKFPFPFIEAVNQWATLPERIERALTWTTFGLGFACGTFVAAGWILAATRANSNRNA